MPYHSSFPGLIIVLFLALIVTHASAKNRCAEKSMYSDPNSCRKFFQCVFGKPVSMSCQKETVFNEELGVCVHAGSYRDNCTRQSPVRACDLGNADFIPHPKICHRYYDCSRPQKENPYSSLGKYEKECIYPLVFDIHLHKCMHYTIGTCGKGRKLYKWQCDYESEQCLPAGRCPPCKMFTPSCINKTDGVIPLPMVLWSPYYSVCKDERNLYGRVACSMEIITRTHRIFHPNLKQCVSVWKIPTEHDGFQPSCKGKKSGVYTVIPTPRMNYKCPGTKLFYCKKPYEIDPVVRCQPFDA